MKRNLIFALSVFALTISGLLVFCESEDSSKKDTIENHMPESNEENTIAELSK